MMNPWMLGLPNCWTNQFPHSNLLGIAWISLLHEAEISNKYAEVSHAKHHLSNISTYSMYIVYSVCVYSPVYIYTYIRFRLVVYIYIPLLYHNDKNSHDNKKHKKK